MTLRTSNGIGKSLVVGLCAAAVCWGGIGVASADEFTWAPASGPGGDWNDVANWYNTTAGAAATHVPTAADDVETNVTDGSTAANPIVIDSPAFANTLYLSYDYNHSAYLEIDADLTLTGDWDRVSGKEEAIVTHNAGTVTVGGNFHMSDTQASPNGRYLMGPTSTGVLNITGDLSMSRNDTGNDVRFIQDAGTVTVGGNLVSVNAIGTTDMGYSAYELNGGSLTVTGGLKTGGKTAGWTDFVQTGGIASFGSIHPGSDGNDPGHGRVILSAAAQTSTTGNLTIGGGGSNLLDTGVGVVSLNGSRTGAGTDLIVGGDFVSHETGMLAALIDQDAINDAGHMRLLDVTGDVTFDAGSLLDIGFAGGATPTAGTWTLLTTSGVLTDSGLAFASGVDTSHWSFNASGSALTVTYTAAVPEPATGALVLLGLGGMLMLGRRKRMSDV